MNDEVAKFPAFLPATPKAQRTTTAPVPEFPPFPTAPEDGALASHSRRPRKKREPAAAVPGKPSRKQLAASKPTKVSLAILPVLAGMKEADVELLSNMIHGLQEVSKASQRKILTALARALL